ncbi:hypothetical protein TYRP_021135 [Tyrophagus putrescentiae]|nr:hypothetical protein TYRP_021135 [Tyrophagus putrescentiae]
MEASHQRDPFLYSMGFANLPGSVRDALFQPYLQARELLFHFDLNLRRPRLLNDQMAMLRGLLYGLLASLVRDYRRFEREADYRPPAFPGDFHPEDPFFNVDRMFGVQGNNANENAPLRASWRHHSGPVIGVKTVLVDLLQNIYEDIYDAQNLEEEEKGGDKDEDAAEAHARAQMAPMLATANQFLGSVQQMMAALHRCIEEAAAAVA